MDTSDDNEFIVEALYQRGFNRVGCAALAV